MCISSTFQDVMKKSSTFQGPKLTSRLFKTTNKIQDLFKIVRTMYYEPTIACSPVDLISLTDKALYLVIERSGFDSCSKFFSFSTAYVCLEEKKM